MRIRVPGIGLVIGGALIILAAAVWSIDAARERGLDARAARADSTARVRLLEAAILKRDRDAALATADSAQQRATAAEARADSLETTAAAGRAALLALARRAAAARERVDTTGLPASLLEALAVTDSLRIAVTPAIAADAGTITALHATIDADHETIVQLRGTIALDTAIIARHVAALAARESELQLERQKHAPRCSAKCGAALGIGAVVLVRAGLKLVLEAIR